MTSRVGPRAAATNGNDSKHRERVAPHYQMRQVHFYLFLMLFLECKCYLQIGTISTKTDILLSISQCLPEVRGAEVKFGPPSDLAAGCCAGDCQPLQPGVT